MTGVPQGPKTAGYVLVMLSPWACLIELQMLYVWPFDAFDTHCWEMLGASTCQTSWLLTALSEPLIFAEPLVLFRAHVLTSLVEPLSEGNTASTRSLLSSALLIFL